jgi:hypothetical protein
MAINTAIAPQTGAPAVGQKVQVYQREIDFSVNALASGAHFQLFTLDAGDVILGGACEVVDAGTGNHDLTLGTAAGSTDLLTATPVDTKALVATTNTVAVIGGSTGAVNLHMTVANAATGVVRVTLAVLKAGDFSG